MATVGVKRVKCSKAFLAGPLMMTADAPVCWRHGSLGGHWSIWQVPDMTSVSPVTCGFSSLHFTYSYAWVYSEAVDGLH